MADLDFRILGSLEASCDGQQLALGGAKQRALLAILLVSANRVVTTDYLVEALWPKKSPGKPLTAIQGYVSHLRKALGQDTIVTEPSGYRVIAAQSDIDFGQFEQLTEAGRSALDDARPRDAQTALTAALALFRGPPLVDFTYEAWAQPEVGRIEEMRLAALEDRIDADLALGHHAEVVGELETLIGEHSVRERLRGQLMLALYRAGRQSEALDVYQATRTALVEGLGLEPGPPLQNLHQQILNHDPGLASPDRQAAGQRVVQLPTPATTFIGRERELAEVVRLLCRADTRLLSLTGPGGVGKTRLSLRAAEQAASHFAGGVYFCALAPLREASHALPAIAQALDVQEEPPTPLRDVLAKALVGRNALLVLDNAEHLLPAIADDVAFLRSISNGPSLLVSSRERLDLQAEQLYAVPTLETKEGVELFGERAHRANPNVDKDDPTIAELCERLDFLPLAIELAAARSDIYTPGELVTALSGLEELLVGARDVDQRHRTLAATISWGYQLLTADEQRVYRALTVFAGGFTTEAATAVSDASLTVLASLGRKSFLRTSNASFGRRYSMLETIREFGAREAELHDEAREVFQRASAYFAVAFSDLEDAPNHGSDNWAEVIQAEHENVLAVMRGALRNELAEEALALAVAVSAPWYSLGLLELGESSLEHTLSKSNSADPRSRARAYRALGRFQERRGEREKAIQSAQSALAIHEMLGDLDQQCIDLGNIGAYYLDAGDTMQARAFLEQTLKSAEELGDELEIARATFNLGLVLDRSDSSRRDALRFYERSYELTTSLGHTTGALLSLAAMGESYAHLGEFNRAFDLLAQSLELAISTRNDIHAPTILESLAECAIGADDADASREFLRAADIMRDRQGSAGPATQSHDALRDELDLTHDNARSDSAVDLGRCLERARTLAAAGAPGGVASRPNKPAG